MTEGHLPPDADGALPGPVAGQPAPAPSPSGPAPPGTSPVAIASFACGTGALVLPLGFLIGGAAGTVFLPLEVCACIAAVVLGVVALVQIRRTRQRGTGLAAAGLGLGCAIPLLWVVLVVVLFAIACKPPNGC
jgi:hypothetical protein